MYPFLNYNEPLYRPPSEAYSLIFQLTHGCSWNKCVFCEMYKQKSFKVRDEEVIKEIQQVAPFVQDTKRVFLADGDAMTLPTIRLLRVLNVLNSAFPKIHRISAYASAKNILSKSKEELQQLFDAGLKLLYIGIESGDDALLHAINKGETSETFYKAISIVKSVGIKVSVMILNGLGGKLYSIQHAQHSAELINKIQPEYLSLLVLTLPYGEAYYKSKFYGNYQTISDKELLMELYQFIECTDLKSTIFRSNHVSNYISLEGVLGKDKAKLLDKLKPYLNDEILYGRRVNPLIL